MNERLHADYESEKKLSSQKSLYEEFGSLRLARGPFSLLSGLETVNTDVKEWTTAKTENRIITFKGGSGIEDTHDYLSDNGVDLLSKQKFGKDIVMVVPEGSLSMRFIAGITDRDRRNYPILFRLLGEQLRKIHDSGAGLPSGNWLDQFVYHADKKSDDRAKIVFLPPYQTSQEVTDVPGRLVDLLSDTGKLTGTMVTQLKREAYDGWTRTN